MENTRNQRSVNILPFVFRFCWRHSRLSLKLSLKKTGGQTDWQEHVQEDRKRQRNRDGLGGERERESSGSELFHRVEINEFNFFEKQTAKLV